MRLFPRFRKLFGLVEKQRATNLDAAMIRVANSIRPDDSFCIKEINWRHGSAQAPREFQVTLFVGNGIVAQVERPVLQDAVSEALGQYEAACQTRI